MEKKQNKQTKRGLGKGLGALIPAAAADFILEDKPEAIVAESSVAATVGESKLDVGAANFLDISLIIPGNAQPRTAFDDAKIDELAASIKSHGIIQPLIVREHGKGKYELIAGERRFRSAKLVGLKEVPVNIIEASDTQVAELSLIENLQREDLSPLEEAVAFRRMIDEYNYTQEALGEILSKSRSYVANSLRLLTLSESETNALKNGEISAGHGRAILSVKLADGRSFLLDEILKKNLSVRQAEDLAKRVNAVAAEEPKKQVRAVKSGLTPFKREMEGKLRDRFGTKVKIKNTTYGGCIEIDYYNDDDLNRILSMVIEDEKSLMD